VNSNFRFVLSVIRALKPLHALSPIVRRKVRIDVTVWASIDAVLGA